MYRSRIASHPKASNSTELFHEACPLERENKNVEYKSEAFLKFQISKRSH